LQRLRHNPEAQNGAEAGPSTAARVLTRADDLILRIVGSRLKSTRISADISPTRQVIGKISEAMRPAFTACQPGRLRLRRLDEALSVADDVEAARHATAPPAERRCSVGAVPVQRLNA
jgi:hypothetical protein